MKAYKFEDFQVGMMEVNDHQVEVLAVIHSVDNGNCGHVVKASVDGATAKKYPVSKLCEVCGVDYASTRTGRTSGTKVVTAKTEEEKVAAKARLAYKDAAKGLEAMEAAGLLSGKALATAKKDLSAKIKAEEERLTKEMVAEKAKKAEEAAAKKARKAEGKKIRAALKALDALTPSEVKTFLKVYVGSREEVKALVKVVNVEVTE